VPNSDHVTVGVPAYRGEAFIEQALHSIQRQTHGNLTAIISLDGPEPATEALCRPFLRDSRFRLVVQPERLGWVGNINWLMTQAGAGFWYYHQQDDLVDPDYVEVLLDHAARAPEAAVVYCDIEAFGTVSFKMFQPSVTGDAVTRQLTLLREHHAAVAFRGLTRVEALRASGGIRVNDAESFSADTTWMASMARWGELHRVPVELYKKRYHEGNEHMRWWAWPEQQRARAWTIHCVDMLEQAMLIEATTPERRTLWLAAVERLTSAKTTAGYLPVENFTAAERTAQLESFFERTAKLQDMDIPVLLDASWEEIRRWSSVEGL